MVVNQQSPFITFVRKFLKQHLALVAFAVLLGIMGVAVLAPWIAPFDPHRPVTVQYADHGIDITQLTRHSPVLEGVLSDGTRLGYSDLPRVEVGAQNQRVVNARRTRSGLNITALTAGHTAVTFSIDELTTAMDVYVRGEVPLAAIEPGLSQLTIALAQSDFAIGEQTTLELKGLRSDGTELEGQDTINQFGTEYRPEAPLQVEWRSLDEGVTSVNANGRVDFLTAGEGLVQARFGDVTTLAQFAVGGAEVAPRLINLSLADYETNLTDAYKHQRPSGLHWFGTDHQNRDIFSRVLHGTRDTLMIGFVSVAIGTLIGTVLGLLAGFYGGRIDNAITRVMDVLLAFPGILLAIAVIAFLGAGLINIIFAVAVFTVPVFVRIVRASTLSLKEMTYVEAARSIGVRDSVIIARHIFPGTLPVVLVYLTMRIGVAILIGAALSFLGLGGDITAPEWGSMLSAAKDNSSTVFHATFFPGLAIVITVLSFNIFGDGLRDALDPKLKE
ncbi:MAG: ABC transporter permease subunit [Saccharospirillum sp.]|nr:ABC transporter permease subunit [Saccharospirillum sp.]